MSAPILLDASCVLAWLFDEKGAKQIEPILTTSFITSANMAEVITKVERLTGQGHGCADDLVEAGLTVIPVGWQELAAVADIRKQEGALPKGTKLSLGDTLCLAVGLTHDMEVWTADRAWGNLQLPIQTVIIR